MLKPVVCALAALILLGCSSEQPIRTKKPKKKDPTLVTKQQRDVAMLQIKTIENAANLYYKDHDEYPQSLEQLLLRDDIGGPYLKDKESILTPWKIDGQEQSYSYDPTAVDANGLPRPKIWVTAPDGKKISNY